MMWLSHHWRGSHADRGCGRYSLQSPCIDGSGPPAESYGIEAKFACQRVRHPRYVGGGATEFTPDLSLGNCKNSPQPFI